MSCRIHWICQLNLSCKLLMKPYAKSRIGISKIWVITHIQVQFKNNFTSNSQVITQGKVECNLTVMIIPELHKNMCYCLLIIQ